MASVLNNEISNISPFVVVDCRYPYEYEAGHVQVCLHCLLVLLLTFTKRLCDI